MEWSYLASHKRFGTLSLAFDRTLAEKAKRWFTIVYNLLDEVIKNLRYRERERDREIDKNLIDRF